MEMLQNLVYHKDLPFKAVLMDSWYATNKLMLYIDDLGKYYYCPLKRNRLVDDTGNQKDYQKIELLSWDEEELKSGKIVKIKKFPGAKKVKLFRVTVSTDRTDFIEERQRAGGRRQKGILTPDLCCDRREQGFKTPTEFLFSGSCSGGVGIPF